MNTEEKGSKVSEKKDNKTTNEKKRPKGRMNRDENKARPIAGKTRTKKAGHEAVSDQKSHEYH